MLLIHSFLVATVHEDYRQLVLLSFSTLSSSGFSGAAPNADWDLRTCLCNRLGLMRRQWPHRKIQIKTSAQHSSEWAPKKVTPQLQRSRCDRVQSLPYGDLTRPPRPTPPPPVLHSMRQELTHPVPDDLPEASVRLEVTLEGNSLPDDDGRQGLDGDSQISFKTERDKRKSRLASSFWTKNIHLSKQTNNVALSWIEKSTLVRLSNNLQTSLLHLPSKCLKHIMIYMIILCATNWLKLLY